MLPLMIIVTGAAGFIGSQIAKHILAKRESDLVVVDQLKYFTDRRYLEDLKIKPISIEDSHHFLDHLNRFKKASWIIHMGAISNTGETDSEALKKWNVDYTKSLWNFSAENKIPLIYASSAATYGGGEFGFADDEATIRKLQPLNLYGKSKQEFDLFALDQNRSSRTPPHWYGLKFFNVYGPHENHKDRMASSIWHGFSEIKKSGEMTLFKSHNPEFKDGEQARDFVYVKDVLTIVDFLISKRPGNGIYNVGTGQCTTFSQLAQNLFVAMEKPLKIKWIPTPELYRAGYQYKTQAPMEKIKAAGFSNSPIKVKEAVMDYVQYLNSIFGN